MSESPYGYSFDCCLIFQGFGLPGYLLVYSSLLFRVSPEQLDQWNVPTSDKTKILKVIQSQGIQKSFVLVPVSEKSCHRLQQVCLKPFSVEEGHGDQGRHREASEGHQ